MDKIYIYGPSGYTQYPKSQEAAARQHVELHNRDLPEDNRLKIHVGSSFPPDGQIFQGGRLLIIAQKTLRQKLIDGSIGVAEYKAARIKEVNVKYAAAMDAVLGAYAEQEREGWTTKENEARAWKAYDGADREPLKESSLIIVNEAGERYGPGDEYIDRLANAIVLKADALKALYGRFTGIKDGAIDAIKAAGNADYAALDDAISSIMDSITFTTGEPT